MVSWTNPTHHSKWYPDRVSRFFHITGSLPTDRKTEWSTDKTDTKLAAYAISATRLNIINGAIKTKVKRVAYYMRNSHRASHNKITWQHCDHWRLLDCVGNNDSYAGGGVALTTSCVTVATVTWFSAGTWWRNSSVDTAAPVSCSVESE